MHSFCWTGVQTETIRKIIFSFFGNLLYCYELMSSHKNQRNKLRDEQDERHLQPPQLPLMSISDAPLYNSCSPACLYSFLNVMQSLCIFTTANHWINKSSDRNVIY